jgi:hypothetical protein
MYLFLGLMLFLVYRDIARSRRIHAAQDKIRQEMSEKAAKDNVSTNAAPNASGQK